MGSGRRIKATGQPNRILPSAGKVAPQGGTGIGHGELASEKRPVEFFLEQLNHTLALQLTEGQSVRLDKSSSPVAVLYGDDKLGTAPASVTTSLNGTTAISGVIVLIQEGPLAVKVAVAR
jgi:hypothetical protein